MNNPEGEQLGSSPPQIDPENNNQNSNQSVDKKKQLGVWALKRLLPVTLGIFLVLGIAIAAVPSWRNYFTNILSQFGPRADFFSDSTQDYYNLEWSGLLKELGIENIGSSGKCYLDIEKNIVLSNPPVFRRDFLVFRHSKYTSFLGRELIRSFWQGIFNAKSSGDNPDFLGTGHIDLSNRSFYIKPVQIKSSCPFVNHLRHTKLENVRGDGIDHEAYDQWIGKVMKNIWAEPSITTPIIFNKINSSFAIDVKKTKCLFEIEENRNHIVEGYRNKGYDCDLDYLYGINGNLSYQCVKKDTVCDENGNNCEPRIIESQVGSVNDDCGAKTIGKGEELRITAKPRPELVVAPIVDYRNSDYYTFTQPVVCPELKWNPLLYRNLGWLSYYHQVFSDAPNRNIKTFQQLSRGQLSVDDLFKRMYPDNQDYRELLINKSVYPIKQATDFDYMPIFIHARKITDNDAIKSEFKSCNFNEFLNRNIHSGIDSESYKDKEIDFEIKGSGAGGKLGYLHLDKDKINDNLFEYTFEEIEQENNKGKIKLNSRGFATKDNAVLIYKPDENQPAGRVEVAFTLHMDENDGYYAKNVQNQIIIDVNNINAEIKLKDEESEDQDNNKTYEGFFKINQGFVNGSTKEEPLNKATIGESLKRDFEICAYEQIDKVNDKDFPICLPIVENQEDKNKIGAKIIISDINQRSSNAGSYKGVTIIENLNLDEDGNFSFQLDIDRSIRPTVRITDIITGKYVEVEQPVEVDLSLKVIQDDENKKSDYSSFEHSFSKIIDGVKWMYKTLIINTKDQKELEDKWYSF